MIGRRYLDPGDRLADQHNPPWRCQVLARWRSGGGPRNVLVSYDGGRLAVIPFPRRLRLPPPVRVGDAEAISSGGRGK